MSVTSEDGELSWPGWLVGTYGHDWLVEVDQSFIEDGFNLYGLRRLVPDFREALDVLLGEAPHPDEDGQDDPLYSSARTLYGLIHARFITTSRGLSMMMEKYEAAEFGLCPRYLCDGCELVPVGLSETLGEDYVKLYCPSCQDIYDPTIMPMQPAPLSEGPAGLDGAFFGPTFPHLLLMSRPALLPRRSKEDAATYVPRIFGFRVHHQRGRLPPSAGDAQGAYVDFAARKLNQGPGANPAALLAGRGVRTAASIAATRSAAAAAARAVESVLEGPDRETVDPVHAGRISYPSYAWDEAAAAAGGGSSSKASSCGGQEAASASSRAAGSARGSAMTDDEEGIAGDAKRGGASTNSYVWRCTRTLPLTTAYSPGRRPAADDFNDTEDEEGAGGRRKARRE